MHLSHLRELSVPSWFTINLSYTKKYWDYLLSLLCKDCVTRHILSFTWPTKAEGFLCSSGKLRPYIYTRAPLTPCMLKEIEISFITMFEVISQDTLDIKKNKPQRTQVSIWSKKLFNKTSKQLFLHSNLHKGYSPARVW